MRKFEQSLSLLTHSLLTHSLLIYLLPTLLTSIYPHSFLYIINTSVSSAASPKQQYDPYTAPLSTSIGIAPEDVKHAVGCRREAQGPARGGARAGRGQCLGFRV
jgi:hypothetical protein